VQLEGGFLLRKQYAGGVLTVWPDGPFCAADTLFCGQCFRWQAEDDAFFGVVHGQTLTLRQTEGAVQLSPVNEADIPYFLHYFSLDEDYTAIHTVLRGSKRLAACIDCAPGIRVLHQDFFEVLLTFILSQNNNIPRIRGIVERLCSNFGAPLPGGAYAFPTPQALAGLTVQDLAPLRAGWRAAYLLDAAAKVASGAVSETALAPLSLEDAKALLMTIHGVGPKVADCTLLFGLGRMQAFPVDVWMRRAMQHRFPRGLPRCAARYAGIAQQYIFHAERLAGQAP